MNQKTPQKLCIVILNPFRRNYFIVSLQRSYYLDDKNTF